MGLFGKSRLAFDDIAQSLETEFSEKERSRQEVLNVGPSVLSSDEAASRLFEGVHQKYVDDCNVWIKTLRETDSAEDARFALTHFFSAAYRDFVMMIIEGVNTRITEQNDFILKILDATSTRNDSRVREITEEMRAMKTQILTEEQREAVDSLVNGFHKAQDDLEKGR